MKQEGEAKKNMKQKGKQRIFTVRIELDYGITRNTQESSNEHQRFPRTETSSCCFDFTSQQDTEEKTKNTKNNISNVNQYYMFHAVRSWVDVGEKNHKTCPIMIACMTYCCLKICTKQILLTAF